MFIVAYLPAAYWPSLWQAGSHQQFLIVFQLGKAHKKELLFKNNNVVVTQTARVNTKKNLAKS